MVISRKVCMIHLEKSLTRLLTCMKTQRKMSFYLAHINMTFWVDFLSKVRSTYKTSLSLNRSFGHTLYPGSTVEKKQRGCAYHTKLYFPVQRGVNEDLVKSAKWHPLWCSERKNVPLCRKSTQQTLRNNTLHAKRIQTQTISIPSI